MASIRTAQILSRLTTSRTPPELLCRQLLDACVQQLPVTGVSLVLMSEQGPPGVVAVTDTSAELLEELQFVLGQGPGVDSFRTRQAVLHPDLAKTGTARWPGFTVDALDAGIHAVFALPLLVGEGLLGVLDLYRAAPGPLSPEDLLEARQYTDAATTLLLHLQSVHQTCVENSVSGLMLSDRAELAQASGIVAVQAGVTPEDALVLLRARAYAEGRPVLAVARTVLRREMMFDGVARIGG